MAVDGGNAGVPRHLHDGELRISDSLPRELEAPFSIALLKNSVERLLRKSPECAVALHDEVTGTDLHVPMVPRR